MKNIFELYNIRRRLVRKIPMRIIAVILIAAFLGVMYSIAPAYICSSLMISAVFAYFLCAYAAMSLHEKENDVFEEVLLLHCDSDKAYHASRELLQLGICFVFSLILSVFPVLKSVIEPHFFTRAFTVTDVVIGGGLIFFSGVCGTETADLFHPRIIGRKFGICAVVLISVVAICKAGLIQTHPVFRILDVLMPPVTDAHTLLGVSDSFDVARDCAVMLHMIVYALLMVLIKIRLLRM